MMRGSLFETRPSTPTSSARPKRLLYVTASERRSGELGVQRRVRLRVVLGADRVREAPGPRLGDRDDDAARHRLGVRLERRDVDPVEDAEAREGLLRVEELRQREGLALGVREAVLDDERLRAPVAAHDRLPEEDGLALRDRVRDLGALPLRGLGPHEAGRRLDLRVHEAPVHVEGLQESGVVAHGRVRVRHPAGHGEARRELLLRKQAHPLDMRALDDGPHALVHGERHVERVLARAVRGRRAARRARRASRPAR